MIIYIDGTPCAVKVACTVWAGGKDGDYIKVLPISIKIVQGNTSNIVNYTYNMDSMRSIICCCSERNGQVGSEL